MRTAFLVAHVAAGFAALVLAPVAMSARKGGAAHRRFGLAYAGVMAVAVLTAAVLVLAFDASAFLGLLALFSGYLVASGYRSIRRRGARAGSLDRALAGLALGGGVAMIVWGLRGSPVLLVFGALSIALGVSDLVAQRKQDLQTAVLGHMRGMLASYMAAVSAFSVTNLHFLPTTVQWLWPTALGTAGLVVWSRKWRRKLAPRIALPAEPDEGADAAPTNSSARRT